ncbi:MAG TPA: hypothetical protein VH596_17715 [Terriglobales bacterium]|jgi:tetratricopeptide (TPR) repeat protein
MKTTVLAFVLASALTASAQGTPQQTQPAAPGAQQPTGQSSQAAPEIKDPAEYNAYVGAVQQKDNSAKISALEAFLTQYPNSVMKIPAIELLMATYQQSGNQAKVVETAKRLLTVEACNLRALALLTFLSRQAVSTGQNPQELSDLTQYSDKGLECVQSAQKPAGISQDDYDKLKKQVEPIFNGGCGFAALQNKDYPKAQKCLNAAVENNPNDLQNVYPLAMSYLTAAPPDTLNGLFYIARAINLAPANAKPQIQSYGEKVYKNYHGSDEGWNDLIATAATATTPPADLATKITKYVPPTPAQQANELVKDKTPDQITQLSFGEWELVLSAGVPEDQNKVWSVIQNKPLQMEGRVIEVVSPTEIHIAGSQDDIEQQRADIILTMSGPIPKARLPKVDDTFDFEGTPASYTATPFMMNMSDGKLLRKAGEPAPKKPVHRRTTPRHSH